MELRDLLAEATHESDDVDHGELLARLLSLRLSEFENGIGLRGVAFTRQSIHRRAGPTADHARMLMDHGVTRRRISRPTRSSNSSRSTRANRPRAGREREERRPRKDHRYLAQPGHRRACQVHQHEAVGIAPTPVSRGMKSHVIRVTVPGDTSDVTSACDLSGLLGYGDITTTGSPRRSAIR